MTKNPDHIKTNDNDPANRTYRKMWNKYEQNRLKHDREK